MTHLPGRWRGAGWFRLVLCAWLLCALPAQAHLMAAQKGTLNIVGDAAFLVLSVPVSALQGADDDGDGALSRAELQAHAEAVRAQLTAGLQLRGPDGPLPLHLVMVDAALPDNAPAAAARQLTVLGRFQLRVAGGHAAASPDAAADATSGGLSLRFSLFGGQAGEQQQDVTVTRGQASQWLRFTPGNTTQALLPGRWSVLAAYAQAGAAHVLGGADHVLFLLVVLSAGWAWRGLLGTLTCFTAGHALTLAACVWGGWSVPGRIVEPAIAATIVGMAGLDVWGRWRGSPARLQVRLALVFGCALIHGLGLAGALTDLTQWPAGSSSLRWALAGFNLGIEAAQVGVAALAGLLWWVLRKTVAPVVHLRASRFATLGVLAVGTVWFAERLLQSG